MPSCLCCYGDTSNKVLRLKAKWPGFGWATLQMDCVCKCRSFLSQRVVAQWKFTWGSLHWGAVWSPRSCVYFNSGVCSSVWSGTLTHHLDMV